MAQTAVEWLVRKLSTELIGEIPLHRWDEIREAVQQAKQMEKQHHDKWNKFLEIEKVLGISDVKTIERIQWYYNQYYNETYGTE
jgi:hypothetical protein